jgi:hypothetical protein
MSRTEGAVDELFEEFEEDGPEEVIALAGEEGDEGPSAAAFEGFATLPERVDTESEEESNAPDLDIDRLFGGRHSSR